MDISQSHSNRVKIATEETEIAAVRNKTLGSQEMTHSLTCCELGQHGEMRFRMNKGRQSAREKPSARQTRAGRLVAGAYVGIFEIGEVLDKFLLLLR
jgi:hypothetical protein